MAQELGDQWSVAVDCRHLGDCSRMAGFCCYLAVLRTYGVKGEEGAVVVAILKSKAM